MDYSLYLSLKTSILDAYLTSGLQVNIRHYVSVRIFLVSISITFHE